MFIISKFWNFFKNSPPKGFLFDKVISITPTGNSEIVYDMTTESHEFIANGLVVHNCHEAVWEIDGLHSKHQTEKGHGPDWQRWMTRVGLDPRRYDPTDDFEYKTEHQKTGEELELDQKYGPRVDPSYFKKLVEVKYPRPQQLVVFSYKGRPIAGPYVGTKGKKRIMEGGPIHSKGPAMFSQWTLGTATKLYEFDNKKVG